jgi:hypothetical protein
VAHILDLRSAPTGLAPARIVTTEILSVASSAICKQLALYLLHTLPQPLDMEEVIDDVEEVITLASFYTVGRF